MTQDKDKDKEPERSPLGNALHFVGVLAKNAWAVFRALDGYTHTRPATKAEIDRGPIFFSATSEDSALYTRRRLQEEAKLKAPTPAPAR